MKPGTILLVEDNRDDEELTLRALRKAGVAQDIVVARDGGEAIDYLFGLGQHAGRDVSRVPAVMLLDLKLPRLNGFDVLRRIRADARTRFVPVVVLTSSSEDDDILRCYECGANSYVRKPVEFAAFISTVSIVGTYWMSCNERPPAQYGWNNNYQIRT